MSAVVTINGVPIEGAVLHIEPEIPLLSVPLLRSEDYTFSCELKLDEPAGKYRACFLSWFGSRYWTRRYEYWQRKRPGKRRGTRKGR